MLHDPRKDAVIAEELFHAGLQPWQLELLAAAEKLKRDGWCRHQLGEQDGPTCAMGSLWAIRGKLMSYGFLDASDEDKFAMGEHVDRLERFIDTESIGFSVECWNDNYAMSVDDVIQLFQYVALG